MSSSSSPIAGLLNRDLQDVETMSQMGDVFEEMAEQQSLYEQGGDGILDIPDMPKMHKGYPVLKGFYPGQFISPKKFSREEYFKWRHRPRPWRLGPGAEESEKADVFHRLGIDPLAECTNSTLMSEFVTRMGRIKKRNETRLTWKNQRKLGKAVRRAKMMGIIPVLSKRPLTYGHQR